MESIQPRPPQPCEVGRVVKEKPMQPHNFLKHLPSGDAALTEMFRVLKVGGRAAFLAWGRFEQPFFEGTVGAILRLVPGTTIPEPARAIFGFATAGSIQEALCRARLRNVQEQHATLLRIWAGSARQLWE